MQRDRKEDQLCSLLWALCMHCVVTGVHNLGVTTRNKMLCLGWRQPRYCGSVSACSMYSVCVRVCWVVVCQCVWRRFERWHRTSSAHSVQALLATTSNQQLVKYCACISHSEFINIDNRSPNLIKSSKWSCSDMEFVTNDKAWLRWWAVVSVFWS